MTKKRKAELRQVAKDICGNLIFTDRNCTSPQEIGMVFAIFMFMKPAQIKKLRNNPPGLIYEYYKRASPRSINGLPFFMSCTILNKAEAQVVNDYVKAFKKAEDKII